MTKSDPKNDNGSAIAALVLGLVSFAGPGPLTGIPAIILGISSLKNPTNRGLGIAGIILGGISTAFALIALLIIAVFIIIAIAIGNQTLTPSDTPYDQDSTPTVQHQRI